MGQRFAPDSGLTLGLDLGNTVHRGPVLEGSGEVVDAFRGRTTEAVLSARLAAFPSSRVLLEVGIPRPGFEARSATSTAGLTALVR